MHSMDPIDSRRTRMRMGRAAARAFTLIEILVVVSILTVLFAVLLPALSSVRAAAKTVVCTANMKTVSMEFRFFADGTSERSRGDSRHLAADRFWINDFQESLYGLDEFWDEGNANSVRLDASEELMLCPSGAPSLYKRKGFPCGREAVGPAEDVSLAVNMRLYRAVFAVKGKKLLASVSMTHLSERVLDHPYAPLVMDVDGQAATAKGLAPFYTAPPVRNTEDGDPYASGLYWSPSERHGGKTVVGFVGGHVLRSANAADEQWDWSYQAEVGR